MPACLFCFFRCRYVAKRRRGEIVAVDEGEEGEGGGREGEEVTEVYACTPATCLYLPTAPALLLPLIFSPLSFRRRLSSLLSPLSSLLAFRLIRSLFLVAPSFLPPLSSLLSPLSSPFAPPPTCAPCLYPTPPHPAAAQCSACSATLLRYCVMSSKSSPITRQCHLFFDIATACLLLFSLFTFYFSGLMFDRDAALHTSHIKASKPQSRKVLNLNYWVLHSCTYACTHVHTVSERLNV